MNLKSSMRVDRRDFLKFCSVTACGVLSPESIANQVLKHHSEQMKPVTRQSRMHKDHISLFLCGDVMAGRGIDQVLLHPGDPQLYEPYVNTAETYVALAEEVNGPILRPVDFAYIWGDALDELELAAPDVRLKEPYRQDVEILHHDIRRGAPNGPFHLVLCRNLVFTYFDENLQCESGQHLSSSVRQGGSLVIGAHEQLPDCMADFEALGCCRGIYRKTG